jgi:CelD/BcsL family acetyltransferase involved in cellulose biosynthesis
MGELTVLVKEQLDEKLLKKWQRLWDESPESNFHNSPAWFKTCLEGLHIKKYRLLIVENGDRLDAIFPLVLSKRFGVSAWCCPGEMYTDKSSLLLRSREKPLLKALVTKLTSLGNLYLEEFSKELAEALREANQKFFLQKASYNYYLPLQPDPYQFMSNKVKNRLRNRIKKNEEHLTYKSYRGDPKSLESVFEIDAKSTRSKQGKASFASRQEQAFLKTLLKIHGKNLKIDILSYDNVPMIYATSFISHKTVQAFLTAYDGSYAFLSPGTLIHFYIFDKLKEEGFKVFDFSRGVTYLKKQFTPHFHLQYDLLYAQSPLVTFWWHLCDKLYYTVLNSKILYGTYLFFKNTLLRRG